jgi:Mor family transcriptional regulator
VPVKNSDNRDIVNNCFHRLFHELGEKVGGLAVRIVVEELGGLQVHVPSERTLQLEARNRAICREFNGSNYVELAIQYGLKPKRIKQIVAADGEVSPW